MNTKSDTLASAGELLFVSYCRFPERHWPERAQRQAKKVEKQIRRHADALQVPRNQVSKSLYDVARRRAECRRRTVHLANIGSSGSHWLEEMLVRGAGMLGAGEVYIPAPLRAKVGELDRSEARTFVDALLLLHSHGLSTEQSASIVHSLHSARPDAFLEADPTMLRVLLLRNPVDVCLSRTFRKDEYRRDVAADVDDMSYLNQNIVKVKEFLTTAREQVFDLVVRYEDLLSDPVPALAAISALTETPVDVAQLRRSAEHQAADQVRARGSANATNLFVGAGAPVSAATKVRVQRQLRELSSYFGYEISDE